MSNWNFGALKIHIDFDCLSVFIIHHIALKVIPMIWFPTVFVVEVVLWTFPSTWLENNSYIHLLSSLYCQLLVWKAGRPYVAFMQLNDILSDIEWWYSRLSEHYGNQTAAELISCFKQKQSELCSNVAVSGPLSVRKPLVRHSVKWKSFYSLGEWEHIIFMVTLLTTSNGLKCMSLAVGQRLHDTKAEVKCQRVYITMQKQSPVAPGQLFWGYLPAFVSVSVSLKPLLLIFSKGRVLHCLDNII